MEIVCGNVGSVLLLNPRQGGGGHVGSIDGAVLAEHVACLASVLRLGVEAANLSKILLDPAPEIARQPEHC